MRQYAVIRLLPVCLVLAVVMGCDSSVHNNQEAVVAHEGLMPTDDSLIDANGKVSLTLTYVADQAAAKDVPDRSVSYEPLSNFRKAGAYVYIPGTAPISTSGSAAAMTKADNEPAGATSGDDDATGSGNGDSLWGKFSGGLKKLTGGGS